MARAYKRKHKMDTMRHSVKKRRHSRKGGGHRKGKALSSAHKKAISEGLKRYHRGGGKGKKRKSHRRVGSKRHKRRTRRA